MSGYTPVFRSILQSTIWETPPHVKVVWLTLLMLCDKEGIVEGSVPGLARLSVVTKEECREALDILLGPDPDSRTTENEGRRLVVIEGGWQLLNYTKYKEKVATTAQASRDRVARFRDRSKKQPPEELGQESVTHCNVTSVTSVTCNEEPLHTVTKEDVTLCNVTTVTCNDLNIGCSSKSSLSGSDAREGDITCPSDLRLTDDQIGAIRIGSGIPQWAIDQITAGFVANFIADQDDKRPLVVWQKCLSKAVISNYQDPKTRPKKPEAESKPASVEASTLGVTL